MTLASQKTADCYAAKNGTATAWLVEAAAFSVLFLIIDAIVLRCIFPGYFDPFWPHHSDYYMPAAIAYSPAGFLEVLTYPRPVGQIFFWLIGHLGTRGAMIAVLLVVAVNYALIVMLTRRFFSLSMNWKLAFSATLFAYLLASHPYQYQMSTWDSFAQLSLLLLLLATTLRMRGGSLWTCAVLVLLAFLAKETYILSAALLAVTWFALQRFRKASIVPILVVGCSAVFALAAEHFLSSPFTAVRGMQGGPYEIIWGIHSVASEWFQYAIEGMNWLGLSAIILAEIGVALVFGIRSKEFLLSSAFLVAGLFAWLPNSLLPNHHFAGYSWNGAYLFYAPVIVLAALIGQNTFVKILSSVIAAAAISNPILSAPAFAKQDWMIMNQKRQKQFLLTLGGLMQQLPAEGKTVLVSGVNFPYSPFGYKGSLRAINKPANTNFIVVAYEHYFEVPLTIRINSAENTVTMIDPSDVSNAKFDEAWLIRSDGTLIKRITDSEPQVRWSDGGFTQVDTLKYPELADSLGPDKRGTLGKSDGYRYLDCGIKLLEYKEPALAEKCLKMASSLVPENPYPHYYLGVSLERQNKIEEAKNAYGVAVKTQAQSPNPIFEDALGKLR
jgi:hypothetical protein